MRLIASMHEELSANAFEWDGGEKHLTHEVMVAQTAMQLSV